MLTSAILTQITRRIAVFVQNNDTPIKFSIIATGLLGFMFLVKRIFCSTFTGPNVLFNRASSFPLSYQGGVPF